MVDDEPVTIALHPDEALVLFELLSRYEDTERLSVEGVAEELALWRLHGSLQRVLVTPLLPDYAERLSGARERLRVQAGDASP
ncbi:MAG: hypothetical protein JWN86_3903 [Planctomycetota bacterium]|nr:hypothetical protein [Planctomycetota bacterium]